MLALEAAVCLGAVALFAWLALRPVRARTGTLWGAGWAALIVSGVSELLGAERPVAWAFGGLFAALFPFLQLAGCLRFAGRPLPRLLLPVGLALGFLRTALRAAGAVPADLALAAADVALLGAAAFVLLRFAPQPRSRAARALGPAFLLLAGLDAFALLRGNDLGATLIPWFVAVIGVSVLQWLALLERLGGSRERLRHINELLSDYSYAVRVERGVPVEREWLIGAFPRITGYEPEELSARNGPAIVYEQDWQRVYEAFQRLRPGDSLSLEYRIVAKGGEIRWIHERARLVRDPDTGTLRLYGAAHEVTERKRIEEERRLLEARVRETQRLESLGALAGGIAHDFNNLLAVVLGNATVALQELPEEAPLRRRLSRIKRAAEVAAQLTEQMLTYAGRASFELKPLDLGRVVDGMRELLESALPQGATLDVEGLPRLPWIRGGATQIQQVLLNLVTNAGEALGADGGRIRLRTGWLHAERGLLATARPRQEREAGEYVFLEVADDGVGMDADTVARVFEPFFSSRAGGRGLGLAAVLGIVRGHGGAILVESEPGRGSCFRVLFPVTHEAAPEEHRAAPEGTPEETAVETRARREPTVLVVDDDDPVREIQREFLERAGFRAIEAASGREAVRRFQERRDEIDVVLLDLRMPDLRGDEVLDILRDIRSDVKVVLSSGFSEDAAAARFRDCGLAGFVQKPCAPEELAARVRAALGEPASEG